MIVIGAFKEAFGKEYKPFDECISNSEVKNKRQVLEYLKGGKVVAVAGGALYDIKSGERIPGETLCYSDGKYIWRSDLIYYLDKYNFKLPDSFINSIA